MTEIRDEEVVVDLKDQQCIVLCVTNVVMTVKCLSNHLERNQFTVVDVLKQWETPLATETEEATGISAVEIEVISEIQEEKRCFQLLVINVVKNVRYLSNQVATNQFTVVDVLKQ